ncbi:hypothetical protein TrVE_jg4299 [Triparma verrucosa]|uniref:Uncharacterized protein n=1 Tax=Triparma verrucosa TaxID=1606542 RepID=A0A9W7C455_9STRA|nr:hypothetical protein TrVE_jg4299 [Triparma verrucosa]
MRSENSLGSLKRRAQAFKPDSISATSKRDIDKFKKSVNNNDNDDNDNYNDNNKNKNMNKNNEDSKTYISSEELAEILAAYVPRSELPAAPPQSKYAEYTTNTNSTKLSTSSNSKSKSTTAFPQPVALSRSVLFYAITITTSMIATCLSISVANNLWLVGGLVGVLYGNEISDTVLDSESEDESDHDTSLMGDVDVGAEAKAKEKLSVIGRAVLRVSTKLAKLYIKVAEFCNSIWFMYKTGQLSYAYFKQYEKIDQRFKVQDKMDAWNRRFQEGKVNFDTWEKENEVGRKILAGLRTAWLVEDGRRGKGTAGKKLKVVKRVAGRTANALLDPLRGNGVKELKEVLQGLKIELQTMDYEVMARRVASGFMAYVSLNFIGVLFSTAPGILAVSGMVAGAIYPGWIAGGWRRITQSLAEARDKGKGVESVGGFLVAGDIFGFEYYYDGRGNRRFFVSDELFGGGGGGGGGGARKDKVGKKKEMKAMKGGKKKGGSDPTKLVQGKKKKKKNKTERFWDALRS